MSNAVSIGLLLPNSTIVPMSRDFEKGIKSALKEHVEANAWEIEYVPEFIGDGSREKVDAAFNKFYGYYSVDLIAGIVSNRTLMGLSDKLAKRKKPTLISNLGEHLPDTRLMSSVQLNSFNYWQQVWALGKWGVEKFGPKGMLVSGLYDAGYAFPSALSLGMTAADPTSVMPFAIAPLKDAGKLADVNSTFPHIENYEPDFIFATFCEAEAALFLQEFQRRGLHKKYPLLGLPHLLAPFEGTGEKLDVYTSLSLNRMWKGPEDSMQIEEIVDKPFFLLGYESGLLIAQALKVGGPDMLNSPLVEDSVDGIRGKISATVQNQGNSAQIYLVNNQFDGKNNIRKIAQQLETICVNDERITALLDQPSSGWYNPYLGI
ncbi:ABC transporter substrate-binding protein [Mucilaginibacter lacusdianchii]|uniref:ABC transporter substrate-binding protein n=1 Tax=Mucilaginibacter lacusdianchii TaxID=2684211 RepID=UPI00131B641D|nr:ABC transporter substrate-binding protein [Mucilaginibacter sp. JXJ CY 39]